MQKTVTIILSVFTTTCMIAAAELPAIAGPLDTRDADAIVELHERTITLDSRDLVTDRTLIRKKLITYDSMDSEGDPHLAFNDRYQALDILTSSTITPEGKILHTQENGFNLITPFALEHAPFFTDGKQIVVTHVGLDLGAVTELDYMISDRERMRAYLCGEELLAGSHPVKEKVVKITVPAGTILRYAVLGCEAEHESTSDASSTTHSFRVTDTPLVHTRYATEAERSFMPRLVYSTASGWQEAAQDLFGKCSKAGSPDEKIKVKAAQLSKDAGSDYRKLHALHGYVHDSVRGIHWPLDGLPGTPRSAGEVYASRYGLPLERALLLHALLESTGIGSEIVMVSNAPYVAKEVPSMDQFQIPLLEVTVEGRTLLVDPEAALDRDMCWKYSGHPAVRYQEGRPEHFIVKPSGNVQSTFIAKAAVTLNDSLAGSGQVKFELTGRYSPHTRCLLTGEKAKEIIDDLVSKVCDCLVSDSVETVELSPERSAFLSYVRVAPPVENKPLTLTLGNGEGSISGSIEGLHMQSRDLPVLPGCTAAETIELELTMPEKKISVVLPPEAELTSGKVHAKRTVSRAPGSISIVRNLEIGECIIDPEDYPALRQAVGIVTDPNSNTVFLIR